MGPTCDYSWAEIVGDGVVNGLEKEQ